MDLGTLVGLRWSFEGGIWKWGLREWVCPRFDLKGGTFQGMVEGEEKRVRSRVLLDPEYWGFGDCFVLRCNDQFAWTFMIYFERWRGTIITGVRARISSLQEGPVGVGPVSRGTAPLWLWRKPPSSCLAVAWRTHAVIGFNLLFSNREQIHSEKKDRTAVAKSASAVNAFGTHMMAPLCQLYAYISEIIPRFSPDHNPWVSYSPML